MINIFNLNKSRDEREINSLLQKNLEKCHRRIEISEKRLHIVYLQY